MARFRNAATAAIAGSCACIALFTSTPVYPADRLAISRQDTAPYRRSYQFLAYGGRGHLPADIPGDDRPDLVAALHDDAETWLRAATP
ncbi:hypothetical protein [Nonomuraea sp. NPDC049695]|uniref:hypothetical protein n=1 Tax=Nonomuraea sp. NPDC049695 TaxID=3154734 RepID=UPI0034341F14